MVDEGESMVHIDPSFKCTNCGGNTVFRGTKTCFNCANGAEEAKGLQDLVRSFTPKKLTGKNHK